MRPNASKHYPNTDACEREIIAHRNRDPTALGRAPGFPWFSVKWAQLTDNERFAQLFSAPYGIRRIELSTAAYESLKSMGLQTVLNAELRLSIAKVFDHHYETLAFVNEVDTNAILGIMRPYYLMHFSDLEFLQSASPLDYEFIIQDSYFQNIVAIGGKLSTRGQMRICT